MIRQNIVLAGVAAASLLAATGFAFAADVTYERLLNPEAANWLSNNRTYDSNRYSPLDEITKANVGDLKVAFTVPLTPSSKGAGAFWSSLQGTPLVEDGTMYMSDGWGRIYAIDLSKGDRGYIKWIMDPQTSPELATGILNNRGVALYGDSIYSITPDCGLLRVNKQTGEVLWRVETQQDPVEYCTMAPLAIKDKIIIGPAGGDGPMRGRLEARNPENGDLIWTFGTVLDASYDEGAATGGGAVWVTGSYDVERNELIWGIGNPYPDWEPAKRPGDNLYTNSTVALDADTGEVKWHFQYTPNDSWDFDEVGTQQIYKANVNGTETSVVGHFGRNGFFYNLDGSNGAYLNGTQYAEKVTWTKGIDPKTGKPLEYDPALKVQTYLPESRMAFDLMDMPDDFEFCPYWEGGVNMFPTTYSHDTKQVYGLLMEGCTYNPKSRPEGEKGYLTGAIVAIDTATGQISKRTDFSSTGRGGLLSTAGGVVIGTSSNGDIFALDDTSLERLWNFNVGTMIDAPPITFQVNGKQYIGLAVGPGGVGLGFHNYPGKNANADEAAAAQKFQPATTMYFFSL
ncbi:pyrroloquinoline quinone-dependent dehydrogenase [Devosia sp. A16]|uniref:pyrroloquinoline quinone-dependent dehydrogenase n=1 Tax=Devosia sp. A16 TaxID=1736675 RepID=UPI0006D8389B|nr:PQQ-binding-like beta-propeller repeat protein [Devosia sp. A16]